MVQLKYFILIVCLSFANSTPILDSIDDDVTLNLFTRSNTDSPIQITEKSDIVLNGSNTLVILHGWMTNDDELWVHDMKDKYLIKYDSNVIAVDWSKYAHWEYALAVGKSKPIGTYIGKVLSSLVLQNKIKELSKIHIVGHGLGAHIAGFAGKKVKKDTAGSLLGRITGLDPVRGWFEIPFLVSDKDRLSKHDAHFVDVIHTSAGVIGMNSAIGHADFYPNDGGSSQPGCPTLTAPLCSYNRAYILFIESINSDAFVSTKCNSWKKYEDNQCPDPIKVPMGLPLDVQVIGKFYLYTNGVPPYARGDVNED